MATPHQQTEKTTIGAILKFFWPLAATSVLMMGSHSLGSSAMGKTADPELALAALGVAQSLAMMFEGAVGVSRQLGLARIRDRQSWWVIARLMTTITLSLISVMALIAFTPLGSVVFARLMGAPTDVARDAVLVLRYYLIFPAISCLRFTYHGLIVLRKRTYFTTIAMAARVSVMIAMTAFLIRNPPALGGAAGAFVLLSGIGAEAIICWLSGRRLVKELVPKDPAYEDLTFRSAFRFFVPLALSGFVTSLSRVALSTGLARTADPKTALAVYQVTWTLAWIFVNPITILHQVTVVFGRTAEGFKQVMRFARALGIGGSLLGLGFVFSGAAKMVLTGWIGLTDALIGPSLWVIGLMMMLPLVTSWTEISVGRLLLAGDSFSIGAGRTIFVLVLTGFVLALALLMPTLGATVAPLALLAGTLAEAGYLRLKVSGTARSILPLSRRQTPETTPND